MQVKTFAALGVGVIGSGWVSRALAHGLDVVAWDPAPGAEQQLRANVANAWPALERVGLAKGASQERLRFVATIEECVADADFIQESAPEREDLKLTLHEKASGRQNRKPSSRRRHRACCRRISTRAPRTRRAASWAIRSIRSICCRWSKWLAVRKPRKRRCKPHRRSMNQ